MAEGRCGSLRVRHSVWRRTILLRTGWRWAALFLGFGLLSCGVTATAQDSESARIVPIYGEPFTSSRLALDEQGQLLFDDGRSIHWTSVRRIEWKRPLEPSPALRWSVLLIGNGRLEANGVLLTDDSCRIATDAGEIIFPIEQLVGIVHRPNASAIPFEPAGVDEDRLVVRVEDGVQAIDGLLESIGLEGVEFEFEGAVRQIPWDRIVSLALATAGAGDSTEGMRVELIDGSSWFGRPLSCDGSSLRVAVGPDSSIDVALERVASLSIVSDRIVQLSSLEPLEHQSAGLLLPPRDWQRNRSVSGEPMRLVGSGSFEFGLGVPSGTTLTFDGSDFDRFQATVGVDASTRGQGDCEVVVRLDDREAFRARVRGTDSSPINVDVPLDGASKLTLAVEFGEGLELGDHVDWCDARLVRTGE